MRKLNLETLMLTWYHKGTPLWQQLLALSVYALGAGFVYGFLYMACLLQSVR